jgi:hypothetical protein
MMLELWVMRLTVMGRALSGEASGCSEVMLSLSEESESLDESEELVDRGDNWSARNWRPTLNPGPPAGARTLGG